MVSILCNCLMGQSNGHRQIDMLSSHSYCSPWVYVAPKKSRVSVNKSSYIYLPRLANFRFLSILELNLLGDEIKTNQLALSTHISTWDILFASFVVETPTF